MLGQVKIFVLCAKPRKNFVLTWWYRRDIITNLAHLGLLFMKLSEFIKTYALQAYLDYCKRNKLEPVVDIKEVAPAKVCALLKPKSTENNA